ncbi:hypothetical protein UA08_08237 [Talaromyces atroroseus]|uniref:Uncharacterized protein n=1 Tax=Talaromyces atroroseus TaxID=1441469 RepID=A0A225A7K6_TALAT|nr:hypothetical protein UA08_08237 [Talaromyces atroroseus]OKL56651.1 hypothetical protein UA08_08237 [Talaromyces atroroseus]
MDYDAGEHIQFEDERADNREGPRARSSEDDTPYMIKISLKAERYLVDDIEENDRLCRRHAGFEKDLIKLVHQIGHGPKQRFSIRHVQGEELVYRGGGIWCTLMDRVPGDDVDMIRHKLTT